MTTLVIPAFSNLTPTLTWQLLTGSELHEFKKSVLSALNNKYSTDSIEQLKTNKQSPEGYFRLSRQKKAFAFVKVLPWLQVESLLKADDTSLFLTKAGVNTPRVSHSKKITVNGTELGIICSDYFSGELFTGSQSDILSLAKALAEVHRNLRFHPNKNQILNSAITRHQYLIAEIPYLKQTSIDSQLKVNDAWLFKAKAFNQLALISPNQLNAQVLHGDINVGNVLFKDDKATLIDFEESWQSYSTPMQDIAFIIERFIYQYANKNESEKLLIDTFYQTYLSELPDSSCYLENQHNFVHAVNNVLMAISLRNILILFHQARTKKQPLNTTEIAKFIKLYQQAEARR